MNNVQGIRYRGEVYRKKKLDVHTPHVTPPEETFETIQPYLTKIGVTRLADITGLSRSGIPVFNAIKPHLSVPSITHGKGLTKNAALISAAMEAIERHHCFTVNYHVFEQSYHELQQHYPVIPLEHLAFAKHSLFHPDHVEAWVPGWDILNQEEVPVPFGYVNMGYPPSFTGLHSFQVTSNGFSCGMDFLEAAYQALLEVIERDSIACAQMAAKASGLPFPPTRVMLESVTSEKIRELVDRLQAIDTLPLLFDCMTDTQVPTYNCYLYDKAFPQRGLAHGMGSSLDPEEAMIRAITEAVLARTVFYSGVREMNDRNAYALFKTNGPETVKLMKVLDAEPGELDASTLRSEAASSFEEDMLLCIEKLKQVGVNQIIVLNITEPAFSGAVVKVVVPGLEGYLTPQYQPGTRARSYLGGKKL